MSIRAGRLRHRLQVFQTNTNRNELGASTNERELLGTFWCEAVEIANEQAGENYLSDQTAIKFNTRYNTQLVTPTNDMFIVFNEIEYDITSVVDPRFLKEYLVISCIRR